LAKYEAKAVLITIVVSLVLLIAILAIFSLNAVDVKQISGPRSKPMAGYPFGMQLIEGRIVRQTFKPKAANISGFAVFLNNIRRKKAEGYVTFRLQVKEGSAFRTLYTARKPAAPIELDSIIPFYFPPIKVRPGKVYAIEVTENAKQVGLSTWASFKDSYDGGKAYLDGKPSKGDLVFLTYYQTSFVQFSLLAQILLIAAIGVAVIALSFLMCYKSPGFAEQSAPR